jgi:hypothetical protein
MPSTKKSPRANAAVSQELEEPYAIVNGCDGHGNFFLIGLIPKHSKRGDFTVYFILANTVDGVTNGFVIPRIQEAECWDDANGGGNYTVRITLAEALVLFLDPVVTRTKVLPTGAIPVVRWWQQHR